MTQAELRNTALQVYEAALAQETRSPRSVTAERWLQIAGMLQTAAGSDFTVSIGIKLRDRADDCRFRARRAEYPEGAWN